MEYHKNFDLTNYNSYRIKSVCRRAIIPHNEGEIVDYYRTHNGVAVLLGSGHNIILSKDYYDEDFVIFNGNYNGIKNDKDILIVEAGASMFEVSVKALDLGLSGVEMFYDIPSSLGGAVVMNAGASGEEIKDVLLKVRYLDLDDLEIKEINAEEVSFEYRNSFFQRHTNKIILKAWLALRKKDKEKIRSKMESIKKARESKQPKEFPNAGSVFKRPPGYYVGAIVDELNLKGFTIGGAKISEKHGGFIVNFNNATGSDIIQIIEEVKKRVFNSLGINLEVEQRII